MVMKNSEVLKQVQRNLKAEIGSGYICFQISNVVSDKATNTDDLHKGLNLKRWVSNLLAPHATYEIWLRSRHPKKYAIWHNAGYPVEARVQWIDWMIKYWEYEERRGV